MMLELEFYDGHKEWIYWEPNWTEFDPDVQWVAIHPAGALLDSVGPLKPGDSYWLNGEDPDREIRYGDTVNRRLPPGNISRVINWRQAVFQRPEVMEQSPAVEHSSRLVLEPAAQLRQVAEDTEWNALVCKIHAARDAGKDHCTWDSQLHGNNLKALETLGYDVHRNGKDAVDQGAALLVISF